MGLQPVWDAKRTQKLQQSLLRWYDKNRRSLPWRDNPTPYRVWISEIMLQQTQVKTVIPYYHRFLERFPDIGSLAEAREQEVLTFWSGLGYYGRARNLLKAARLIIGKHGEFPREYKDILALPGIGRYTAGAISSIAFNQARPVVDGNIQRVITRLLGMVKSPAAAFFWDQMSAWMPEGRSSSFNQAMMELGATVCIPSRPHCGQCPMESLCEARRLGIQNKIPSVRTKPAIKHIRAVILVLERRGRVLLTSLHKPHFIPGEWGMPSQQVLKSESTDEAAFRLSRRILGRTISLVPATKISHSITRYRITAYGYFGKLDGPDLQKQAPNDFRWVQSNQYGRFLTSSLFRKILRQFPQLAASDRSK